MSQRRTRTEKTYEDIMAKIFSNLIKAVNPKSSTKTKQDKHQKKSITKRRKTDDEEKILAIRERGTLPQMNKSNNNCRLLNKN